MYFLPASLWAIPEVWHWRFRLGNGVFARLPLFLPLVGFIYMMEILSVILQVSFLQTDEGKRIFKMTPIHHHFELMGWSET